MEDDRAMNGEESRRTEREKEGRETQRRTEKKEIDIEQNGGRSRERASE